MVGPTVGIDDEVGDKIGSDWFDKHMGAAALAGPTLSIADDPSRCISRGDRP